METASKFEDSLERTAWVGAFLVSMYGDFHKRANKPFNPLLGETFEMVGNGGVKAMSC